MREGNSAGIFLRDRFPSHPPAKKGCLGEFGLIVLKTAAYHLNKYGMVKGRVEYLSPDAAELPDVRERDRKDGQEHVMPPSGFRALVALDTPYLERDGKRYALNVGMLVSAEVNLGSRTVMEYLLSPVQKTVLEAGRER